MRKTSKATHCHLNEYNSIKILYKKRLFAHNKHDYRCADLTLVRCITYLASVLRFASDTVADGCHYRCCCRKSRKICPTTCAMRLLFLHLIMQFTTCTENQSNRVLLLTCAIHNVDAAMHHFDSIEQINVQFYFIVNPFNENKLQSRRFINCLWKSLPF